MITIFCSPKPFTGEAVWNQINALRSWRAINPNIEIIIFGSAPGTLEAAAEVSAKHVPSVECSSSGAPSLNYMAGYASKYGQYDLQLYVNCDILLNASIVKSMQSVQPIFDRFLIVGERLDLTGGTVIDVRQNNWMADLWSLAENKKLIPHGPTGADYFGFRRGMWADLPPVFMGRAMCDNALIHYSLQKKIPVIDASLAVTIIHQHHGYDHVKGGRQEVFNGGDMSNMASLHGLRHSLPTIADSNWRFTKTGEIEHDRYRRRFLRRLELLTRYNLKLEWAALGIRSLQYLFGKKGITHRCLSLEDLLPKKVNSDER